MTKYRVELECMYDWADYIWRWRVFDEWGERTWSGNAGSRWGAKLAAKRAVKKLRAGHYPPEPHPAVEKLWL